MLIASDGLWDEVDCNRVVECLRGPGGIDALVASIADIGEDNITVMLIDVATAVESLGE